MNPIRIYTDFNAQTPDGLCWLLLYNDEDLGSQVEKLGLGKQSKVVLYQDEDDFEVMVTLDFQYNDFLKREAWIATPDWATLVRK
jgi:hypothetical protein